MRFQIPVILTLIVALGDGQTLSSKHKAILAKAQQIQEIFPPSKVVKLEQHEDHLIADVDQAAIINQHIVILDRAQRQVLVYQADGKFLYPIGGTGNGPGEFQSPQYLCSIWGDQIAIKSSEGRLTVYDQSGELKFQLFENHGLHLPRGVFAWPKKKPPLCD